jgi:hypothetical protein
MGDDPIGNAHLIIILRLLQESQKVHGDYKTYQTTMELQINTLFTYAETRAFDTRGKMGAPLL